MSRKTIGGGGNATAIQGLRVTTSAPDDDQVMVWKDGATEIQWADETGGGGGATAFTGLSDTPSTYSGQGGKHVMVNSGASGLEFQPLTTVAFKTFDVETAGGRVLIAADAAHDTLKVDSATGVKLLADASTDTMTIEVDPAGVTTQAFKFINTEDGTDPSASTIADTLQLEGTNITVTGNSSSNLVTFASTEPTFKTIKVTGEDDVVADSVGDTLTFAKAGAHLDISTNAATDTITFTSSATANLGDVVGPGSAADNNFATFDGTTGKLIQDAGVNISSFGDASGPTSAVAGNFPGFDGTTGKFLLDSGKHAASFSEAAFKTLKVIGTSGQADIVADTPIDTLTLKAGSGVTIETNAGTDQLEFSLSATAPGDVVGPSSAVDESIAIYDGTTGRKIKDGAAKVGDFTTLAFKTIAVSGETSIVADSKEDALTFAGGSNITITTNPTTDTVIITGTAGGTQVNTATTPDTICPIDLNDNFAIGMNDSSGNDLLISRTDADVDVRLWVKDSASTNKTAQLSLTGGATGSSRIQFGDGDDIDEGIITYDNEFNTLTAYVNDAKFGWRLGSEGQTGIGADPSASDQFSVHSTSKGSLCAPSMTAVQAASASGTDGSMLYDATNKRLNYKQSGGQAKLDFGGSNTIYVHPEGDDGLDGTSTGNAVKTMAVALTKYASAATPRKLVLLGQTKYETATTLQVTKPGRIDLNGSWIVYTGTTDTTTLMVVEYADVASIWIYGGLLENSYGACLYFKRCYEPICQDMYFYQPNFAQMDPATTATFGVVANSAVTCGCSSNAAGSRVYGELSNNTFHRVWKSGVLGSPGTQASMVRVDSQGETPNVKFNDWKIDNNKATEATADGTGFQPEAGMWVPGFLMLCESGGGSVLSNEHGLRNMPTVNSSNNTYVMDLNNRGNSAPFEFQHTFPMFKLSDRYANDSGSSEHLTYGTTYKVKLTSRNDSFFVDWSAEETDRTDDTTVKVPWIIPFCFIDEYRSTSKKDIRVTFTNLTVDTGIGRLDDDAAGSLANNCGAFLVTKMAWVHCFDGAGMTTFCANVVLANCHWIGTAMTGSVEPYRPIGVALVDDRANVYCMPVTDDSPRVYMSNRTIDYPSDASHQAVLTMTNSLVNNSPVKFQGGIDLMATSINNVATIRGNNDSTHFDDAAGFLSPTIYLNGGGTSASDIACLYIDGQHSQFFMKGSDAKVDIGDGQMWLQNGKVQCTGAVENGASFFCNDMYAQAYVYDGKSGQAFAAAFEPVIISDVETYVKGVHRGEEFEDSLYYLGVSWTSVTTAGYAIQVVRWGPMSHYVTGTVTNRNALEITTGGNYASDGFNKYTVGVTREDKSASGTIPIKAEIGPWTELY